MAEHRKLADRCAALSAEMDTIEEDHRNARSKTAIDEHLSTLEQVEGLPIEFSRSLWNMAVDTLTIHEGKKPVFR